MNDRDWVLPRAGLSCSHLPRKQRITLPIRTVSETKLSGVKYRRCSPGMTWPETVLRPVGEPETRLALALALHLAGPVSLHWSRDLSGLLVVALCANVKLCVLVNDPKWKGFLRWTSTSHPSPITDRWHMYYSQCPSPRPQEHIWYCKVTSVWDFFVFSSQAISGK